MQQIYQKIGCMDIAKSDFYAIESRLNKCLKFGETNKS